MLYTLFLHYFLVLVRLKFLMQLVAQPESGVAIEAPLWIMRAQPSALI